MDFTIDYLTFEERVERYKKWSVEELARELANRDLQKTGIQHVEYPANPSLSNPTEFDFYSTCTNGKSYEYPKKDS